MFGLKLNKYYSNFHLLEVVGCDSETKVQVGDTLDKDNLAGTGLTTCFNITRGKYG